MSNDRDALQGRCACWQSLWDSVFGQWENLMHDYMTKAAACPAYCPRCGDKLLPDGTVEARAQVERDAAAMRTLRETRTPDGQPIALHMGCAATDDEPPCNIEDACPWGHEVCADVPCYRKPGCSDRPWYWCQSVRPSMSEVAGPTCLDPADAILAAAAELGVKSALQKGGGGGE
jgi:hypothetical protein